MKRRRLSKAERQQVYRKCRGRCAYCGSRLRYEDMQVDHVIPLNGYSIQEYDMQALSDRLMNKTEFSVEVAYHSESDNRYKKSQKYRHSMEKKLMDAEDEINRCSQKYLLIHFNVLMDMGYGKKRLTRIKDAMNQKLREVSDPMVTGAMEMRQELMDGVGICIEMPE